VRFRNAQTGQAIRATHIGSGGAASFSPDGRLLAVGVSGGAGTIALLDGAGRVTKMLQAGANVSAIAWVANDRLAAVSDTGVSVWSTHGGKLAQLQAHSDDPPSIAASPNGHVLGILGVTGALSLWDTARLRPLRTLPIDNGGTQLAFTGDGRTLAAGDDSGLVRMWDVQSGQALGAAYRVAQRIAAQPTGIDALAFDPAQTTLALGTSDGTVGRLEHLPFAGPGAGASASATYLCGVVRRSLTRSEWQQLVPDQPYRATCGPRF
jgi:WD40 repeat protein